MFNHYITTDGIGCTLLFIRKDIYKPNKRNKPRIPPKPTNYDEFKYIESLTCDEKKQYINHLIVGLDPGKSDLFYATIGDTKRITKNGRTKYHTTTMRYSQNQRRKELKTNAYKKRLQKEGKIVITDKTVKELETELSLYNSKNCIYKDAFKYAKKKSEINKLLYTHYQKTIYRTLRWYKYINTQRTEAKMINNFKKIFGDTDNTLVVFGDWSESHHRKYHEPTKGKGMRRIFKKAGYQVYLINEYNTSKRSFIDGTEMENFRKRGNKRLKHRMKKTLKKEQKKKFEIDLSLDIETEIKMVTNRKKENNSKKYIVKLCHGLLRSKNVHKNKSDKSVLMNRDFNGSMNILNKAKCLIENKDIPTWLDPKNSVGLNRD